MEKNGTALSSPADFSFTSPKTITLTVAAVSTDFFRIEYDTALSPAELTNLITKADRFIDARMIKVFGEGEIPFTSTPDIINEISTELSGTFALRSFLMKNHGLIPNLLPMSREMEKHAMNMLESIEDGTFDIEGISRTGDVDASAGRTGDEIFTQLDEIHDVDYFLHYDTEDKRERGETATLDL